MLKIRVGIGAALLLMVRPALALQPLSEFLEGAARANVQQRIAFAEVTQQEGTTLMAAAKVLPAFTARGTYTRNQFPVTLDLGTLPGGEGPLTEKSLVLFPANQLDAQLRIELPLIDAAGWVGVAAASAALTARRRAAAATALDVQMQVAREYYRLLGAHALLREAELRLQASIKIATLVQERFDRGVVPMIDAQRAQVAAAQAQQAISEANTIVQVAKRMLSTLTTVDPLGDPPTLEADLTNEDSLQVWENAEVERVPSVAAKLAAQRSAELSSRAAKLGWAPIVALSAQQNFTNATGFVGRSATWTVGATAMWRLDSSTLGNTIAEGARAEVARLEAMRVTQATRDAIHEAWLQVRRGIDKVGAARAEGSLAVGVRERTLERYEDGRGSQIEYLEAEHEAFNAEALQIQSAAELAFARASLRLHAGKLLKE